MAGLIASIAPRWALKREIARLTIERLYKAAAPSNARKTPTDWRSGDAVMDQARAKLRQWGRHLDENHDLTHAALTILSYQTSQVTIEPRVLDRTGKLAERVNDELRTLWQRHRDELDATALLPWSEFSGLVARTLFRDGEVFCQHMLGTAMLSNGRVPYMVQAHEPDLVPFDYIQSGPPRIVHGIRVDTLGRQLTYYVYREHPGDNLYGAQSYQTDTVPVPAAQMSHLAIRRRLGQHRGASVLSPAITRLADVADYEESERLAAKVASSMCAAITRGADFSGASTALDTISGERPMELQPGMILDNLMPGEKVELLNTNRPNPALAGFRKSQLRAAFAGVGVNASSAMADYDGTYSSQRQELVENRQRYDAMRCYFERAFLRPVWQRFVQGIQLAGLFTPRGADPATLFDIECIAPATPWIDPNKEANADETSIRAGISSRHEIIRKRGGDPLRVDDEIEADPFKTEATYPQGGEITLEADSDDEAPALEVVSG